jgi:hypothetical protein
MSQPTKPQARPSSWGFVGFVGSRQAGIPCGGAASPRRLIRSPLHRSRAGSTSGTATGPRIRARTIRARRPEDDRRGGPLASATPAGREWSRTLGSRPFSTRVSPARNHPRAWDRGPTPADLSTGP